MPKSVIQGHDVLPIKVFEKNKDLLRDYLPGYSLKGEYNFTPKATTQMASLQLDLGMHSGKHKWLNDALNDLLGDLDRAATVRMADGTIDFAATEANKTKYPLA